jgi:hypothetical protein
MIDADLAALYGVPTKRLNEQVRRNAGRFPGDSCFQLSPAEKLRWSQIATTSHGSNSHLPCPMPSPSTAPSWRRTCSTARAVKMSVHVVRAFVRLRELIASHKELVKRLDELEERYDEQFKVVFDAIRQLMALPAEKSKRKIGFV